MNNNANTEKALRDVFSTTSYVTIGDKDKPLEYKVATVANQWYLPGVKQPARSCFTGKGLVGIHPVKQGTVPEVYLEKKYNWISDGDKHVDSMGYSKTQPEKKNGFHSGDYRRKDEFTRVFRTEQYREALKSEFKSAKIDHNRREQAYSLPPIDMTKSAPAKPKPYLYDLQDREDEGFPMKCARDTKNPTVTSKERNYGDWKTTNQLFGYGISVCPHSKPEHARIPIVKKTFYRVQGAGPFTHVS